MAATLSAIAGSALCVTATFWTTLLQVYPAGSGAATIFGLQMVSALLFAATTMAAVAAARSGASSEAWAERLRGAPFLLALLAAAATSALLTTLWAITADGVLRVLVEVEVALTALAAAAVLAGRLPKTRGWDLRRFNGVELQMLAAIGLAATLLLGLLARPWETVRLAGAENLPTWWLMAVTLAVGAGAGQLGLQLLRRPGAGVMALMVAIGLRALLISLMQRPMGGFEGTASAYVLPLLVAGVMDLVYFFNIQRGDERSVFWQALVSGVTATLLAGVVVWSRLVHYPPATDDAIPGMIIAGALAGLVGGWSGMAAARWINQR